MVSRRAAIRDPPLLPRPIPAGQERSMRRSPASIILTDTQGDHPLSDLQHTLAALGDAELRHGAERERLIGPSR